MISSIEYKVNQLKIEDKRQTDSYEKGKICAIIQSETNNLTIQTEKNWELSNIFHGAKDADTLLQRRVKLRYLKVYTKSRKFLERINDKAEFNRLVLCDDNVTRPLNEGVFRYY